MNLSDDLQNAIGELRAKVRFGYPWWLRPFLMRGVIAITLGRRIYVSPLVREAKVEKLLRHELVHVGQVARLGLPRFLWRYLAEFIGGWRRHGSISVAYRHISLEEEAFAAEESGQPII